MSKQKAGRDCCCLCALADVWRHRLVAAFANSCGTASAREGSAGMMNKMDGRCGPDWARHSSLQSLFILHALNGEFHSPVSTFNDYEATLGAKSTREPSLIFVHSTTIFIPVDLSVTSSQCSSSACSAPSISCTSPLSVNVLGSPIGSRFGHGVSSCT